MDFGLSEEQELLRAEARKFLDESCPLEKVRAQRRDSARARSHVRCDTAGGEGAC